MVETAAPASTTTESVRASCGLGTGSAGEGAEVAGVSTDGEIIGKPR